jgi:hypothetical protein
MRAGLTGEPESVTRRWNNLVVKTPEQLEDAAIADVIRSVVAIKTRRMQRELQNKVAALVQPKIDVARLEGKHVDVNKLVQEVIRAITAY